jgi:hypothetical protein
MKPFVTEAVAGEKQGEGDGAAYCTPTYAEMEAGASWVLLGHPRTALPILEKSRSEWVDHAQVRDYAMCVSRRLCAGFRNRVMAVMCGVSL